MLSYILLIIIISILLVTSYYIFEKNILSPTFLSCLFFDICAVLATIGLLSWNNQGNISIKLIIIITVALISFGVGEFVVKRVLKNKFKGENVSVKYINVSKLKYFITVVFIIITTIILIKELEKVCIYYGYSGNSLPGMLNFYRMNTSLYNNKIGTVGVDINFIVKQLQKACEIICVFYIYIFTTNLFIKRDKKLLLLLIPIFMCMAQSLLTTGRVVLMKFFITLLFLMIYNYIKYNKKDKWINFKVLGICTSAMIILVSIFYIMIPLLGRENDSNPIDYISFYFGTTIPSFEYMLQQNIEPNVYIGQETFSGLYDSLDKLQIIDRPIDNGYIWIDFIGYRSNVYTSLKAYYMDFGIVGVILCQFIFGFLFTLIYIISKSNSFLQIWYANYVYILIEQIRAEQFFRLISINTLAYTLLIMFIYEFFYDFYHIKNILKVRIGKNEE